MAPKLKTCAKGIVENIVGEPRLGTPARNGVVFSNLGPMLPPLGAGNVVGAHRREQRLRNRAFRNIERQPGTPPDRAPRPNTVGNVAGNTCRCIVATGAAALGVRPGTAVLCRTAMAVLLARLFDFTLRTLESYFSRYWSGQLQATPIKACSARFQGSCAENLGQVPSACPASPAGAIDAPDWTWESLVELGGRAASGILIAL